MLFVLLLKRYDCLKWQAEVNVTVTCTTVAYPILQRYAITFRLFSIIIVGK